MSYKSSPRRGVVRGSLRLRHSLSAFVAAFFAVLLGSSPAFAATGHTGFGFIAPNISEPRCGLSDRWGCIRLNIRRCPLFRRLQVYFSGE